MTILTFSFTGENTNSEATFTIAQEYKFKNLYLEDVKFQASSDALQESINKSTSGIGSSSSDTTIFAPLYLQMDFLDTKDCVLYSLSDAVNNSSVLADTSDSLNTAQNITGLIPIGYPRAQGTGAANTTSFNHNPSPLKLISNRPQTWAVGKTVKFTLHYRNIDTDGVIKDINKTSITGLMNDVFGDECNIDIVLRIE